MLQALPQIWRSVVQQTFRPEPLWLKARGFPAAAAPLVQQASTAQVESVSCNHQLASVEADLTTSSCSVQIV